MRYLAIVALAILGMVELVVRAAVLLVLALSVLGWVGLSCMEASQFEPTCFKLAGKCLDK